MFMRRKPEDGYLLPGTVDDLCRKCLSWIVKWPDEGFRSTSIFNTLQYAGRLRTINDIPPVEVHPRSDCTELTNVMTDDSRYVISPQDLDNIIYMTPGRYPVQVTVGEKPCYDLIIRETLLNGELYQAIKMTKNIVHRVNQWLANPRRGGNVVSKLVRRRSDYQPFLNNFRGTGRLVKVLAILDQATLAITYKMEGVQDAVQNTARDIRHLRAFISHIEQREDTTHHSSPEKRELKQNLDQVKAQISLAEQSRTRIGLDQELSSEPVAKCLDPEGLKINDGGVWNGYEARCEEHNGILRVEAIKSTIGGVEWLTREVIELSLDQQRSKLFVTPLKAIPEGHWDDEVQVGDIAVRLGQCVAIGEWHEDSSGPNAAFSMINYLRIVSVEEQNQSRCGRNRILERNPMLRLYAASSERGS
ncbi:hypothetical protein HO133_007329 [Letharia lupina]|uniref:Uncharacterized protein n=1 Tax=Letharia lupina TaxID=560253 RepID=A0A8H6KYK4_9LECA|nr:uncharacterized protein HO133_007329 [Letharia lupina]KAF6229213.1 hypothetical protein HO133_007329 [Letharia lupina]